MRCYYNEIGNLICGNINMWHTFVAFTIGMIFMGLILLYKNEELF
ncbi:hypothetical protein LCGC14_0730010 [marine sediment metagenome]|uniref:Uncharacterized protein n=1 Tax=marine sediment metagenome TaxID=412755 RepID=A0A0F9QA19_9ZZZZ